MTGDTLPDALRRLADRTRDETGLGIELQVEESWQPLPPATETALLRCAQEALANARRHSGASTVSVSVRRDGQVAALIVRDDGAGFDPAARNGGSGLIGMAERARTAGGRLALRSAPGVGTTVDVRVPA